jgi:Gnt-I system high-affinity gluconate transporter
MPSEDNSWINAIYDLHPYESNRVQLESFPYFAVCQKAGSCIMPLVITIGGVLLLLILITVVKFDAFLSFVIVCLFVGISMGLSIQDTIDAMTKGLGDTLGFLVLILGFGAMLGRIMADSGAAQQITRTMVRAFGMKRLHWALMLTGFVVGIPMFYSVGFVILIPIVFTLAASTRLPLIFVALPMVASLSVTHGLLPPHPAPTAIADMFDADMGKVMMLGIIICIPAMIIAGPLLAPRFRKIRATPMEDFTGKESMDESQLPSTLLSMLAALMPVLLMGVSAILLPLLKADSPAHKIVGGVGDPVMAMLLSVLFALFTLSLRNGKKIPGVMENLMHAVSAIAMILLIVAGAGGLKEILVVSGISDYLADLLRQSGGSPLFLAWLIAVVIRISIGSATVSAMTAAGIVLPLVSDPSVSPELMVLSIGSGSLIASHVNDSGFWMFKEYFNLSIRDTLLTWTLMETVISLVGLAGVFILDIFI